MLDALRQFANNTYRPNEGEQGSRPNEGESKGQETLSKGVLRLKRDEKGVCSLEFILLKDSRRFERFQAWFGCGPLSLANIAAFISENQKKLESEIKDPTDKRVISPLFDRCQRYNAHRRFNKFNKAALGCLFDLKPPI